MHVKYSDVSVCSHADLPSSNSCSTGSIELLSAFTCCGVKIAIRTKRIPIKGSLKREKIRICNDRKEKNYKYKFLDFWEDISS